MRRCAPGNWPVTISTVPPWASTNSRTTERPMPVPLSGPPCGVVAGIERVEHLVALVGVDAGAGVGEVDDGRRAVRIGMQVDRAAARRELERIRQQVLEHELELRPVGDEVQLGDVQVEREVARRHRETLAVDHGADQRAQAERGQLDAARARLPGAVGEQVLDQLLQAQSRSRAGSRRPRAGSRRSGRRRRRAGDRCPRGCSRAAS